ncbi:VOC family protein [Longispora albida]|uniref:VOC family protein n=1 Tax=Longispora albida TaxID=203523 RepID=UPI00038218E7|nr:VOC family protein [Longispora albida]
MQHGIGWFKIGTANPEVTEAFYGQLFGWEFSGDAPYRTAVTPAERSIRGGVYATGGHAPDYAVFCVVVADVPATIEQAQAAGGKVIVPPQANPDGVVHAHLLDPNGTHFAVYSPPPGKDS